MLRSVVCFTGWVFPAVVESESAASDAALNDTYLLLKAAHFLQAHGISRLIE